MGTTLETLLGNSSLLYPHYQTTPSLESNHLSIDISGSRISPPILQLLDRLASYFARACLVGHGILRVAHTRIDGRYAVHFILSFRSF